MEAFTDFQLLRPWWLLALIPAVLCFLALLHRKAQASAWQRFIAPRLLEVLIEYPRGKQSQLLLYLLLFGWVIASFALAGPAWEKRALPVSKNAAALVIVWDLSPSMMAEDIKPSRLVRARLKLIDLLKQRKEGLTALVVYSGEAHTVTPLTDDTRTIRSLLPGLSPEILPAKGSNVEMALGMANQLLQSANINEGTIVVLTDGIDTRAISPLVAAHQGQRHQVVVWGIGTDSGAPIPLEQGGFAKDNRGNIVVAKLNEALLNEAALRLKGVYLPFASDDVDLRFIQGLSQHNINTNMEQSERDFDRWIERGHLMMFILLPLALLAFRRGVLLSTGLAFITFSLFSSEPSHAEVSAKEKLWLNDNQRAYQALQKNDADYAAKTFDDPMWRAIANYKAGDYSAAEENLAELDTAQAHFNRGNALVKLGQYDKAIAAYEEAMALQKNFKEAENNVRIAKALKNLQEQKQKQNSPEQSDKSQSGEQQNQQQGQQEQGAEQDNQAQTGQDGQAQQEQSGANDQQQTEQDQAQQSQGQQSQEQQAQREGQEAEQDQPDGSGSQTNSATEEQQQALEKAYGQQEPQTDNADGEENNLNSQDTEKQSGQAFIEPEQEVLSPEQKEQQQALKQWLRKVPDDPSGLMRNKFEYETRRRRQEMPRDVWQSQGNQYEERW